MKTAMFLLGVLAVVVLTGCATIISGTSQDISVDSRPRARIEITSSTGAVFYSGDSPAIVRLPRKYTYTVTVRASGYGSQTIVVSQRFNAWFIGNIIFGGIPGGVVDAITGAMYNLEPAIISVTLENATTQGQRVPEIVFAQLGKEEQGDVLRLPLTN